MVQYCDSISISVGNCDSHELRRERNGTPRPRPKLAESDKFSVRYSDLSTSFWGPRDCQRFAWIMRVSPHVIFCPSISYSCSKRPWSLFIGFFIILAILGPMLPFLFGRIMVIETLVRVCATDLPLHHAFLMFKKSQRMVYREILIAGDLSQHDVDLANNQSGAFQASWQ